MRVLVTGGTGFIGRLAVPLLAERGHSVRCLVRNPSQRTGLPEAEIVAGDLAEGAGLKAALEWVDVVIHLAGTTKALRREDFFRGNVLATRNLVTAMEGSPVRLVHISSLAAVGPSEDGQPLDEDCAPHPVSAYGSSKAEGEAIAHARAGSVILRPPVVYGPGDTDVFELLRAISRGLVVEIAGGERWFSAIFVRDLAAGIVAAAFHPAASGRTYYLTHSRPATWGELGAVAAAIMNKHPLKLRVPYPAAWTVGLAAEIWARITRKPGIVSRDKVAEALATHWTCSAARATRELGFTAPTALADGIAQTLKWYKEVGWLTY